MTTSNETLFDKGGKVWGINFLWVSKFPRSSLPFFLIGPYIFFHKSEEYQIPNKKVLNHIYPKLSHIYPNG